MNKIRIEEIYSKDMFPGLIIGKPKVGMYEKSLAEIKKFLGGHLPITNVSETKWTMLGGYGSWGHICGVKIQISDGDDRYSFSVIFNFLPEKQQLENRINEVLSEIDWKTNSLKWDIGDL